MRKTILFYFLCSLLTLFAWSKSHAEDPLSNVEAEWNQTAKSTESAFKIYENTQNKSWEEMRIRVRQKWNDGAIPERKTFVEYFDNDSTRIKIDYENGLVAAETLIDSSESPALIKSAKGKIEKALSSSVSSDSKSTIAILTTDEISAMPKESEQILKTLSQKTESSGTEHGEDGQERKLYKMSFKLVPDYIKRRAAKFRPSVDIWAKKYNLDPAFILGIMRAESAFNPRARSSVGAVGLMQVMPQFAGQEVMAVVTGTATRPAVEYLYDPQKNIMIGSTYLQLLRDKYFSDIKDEAKRKYLITASYNWGPHRIKTAIAKGRLSTRSPASEIFSKLQQIAPDETKEYLRRVTQYTKEFQGKD